MYEPITVKFRSDADTQTIKICCECIKIHWNQYPKLRAKYHQNLGLFLQKEFANYLHIATNYEHKKSKAKTTRDAVIDYHANRAIPKFEP